MINNKMVKWGRLFSNMQSFFKKHCIIISSRICVPYYFEKHCIFMRSRFHFPKSLNIFKSLHCLLFYFGEHWIFMRSCLHFSFYHVQLRWRKSYNSFYNPNLDHEMLVYFHIPFPRTAMQLTTIISVVD